MEEIYLKSLGKIENNKNIYENNLRISLPEVILDKKDIYF